MNKLRIRNGVVLLEICGAYLLVSDRQAGKHCMYVMEINDAAAVIFRCIEENMTVKETADLIMEEYDVSDRKAVETDIMTCIGQLKEYGYLTEEEDDL
ncbi:MAG: PqqD family protein [Solobacterium sp.]|nr:PqqD family protein [Solobacterium sp.]